MNLRKEFLHNQADCAPVDTVSICMGLSVEQFANHARH